MKRFIVSVLSISVFFIGLGGLIEKASATFKSDEKALELLRKARAAVGGDAAVAGVKSMTIIGKVTKTFDGVAQNEQGDLEINFELPNRMSKKLKMGSGDGEAVIADKRVDVVVIKKGDGDDIQFRTEGDDTNNGDNVKNIFIKKSDDTIEEVKTDDKQPIIIQRVGGSSERTIVTSDDVKTAAVNGNKVFIRKTEGPVGGENFRSNELLRTTLSLLLTAPEGLDVTYSYVGEGSVDGVSCDIISANDGGAEIKLYLDKSTNLPRMMAYQAIKPFMIRFDRNETKPDSEAKPVTSGDVKVFTRVLDQPEMADFQVKFSDYRSVNGLQLPFKWTQTIGGKLDELIDVTSFEVNPSNIADKFKEAPTKVFIRTKKEQ